MKSKFPIFNIVILVLLCMVSNGYIYAQDTIHIAINDTLKNVLSTYSGTNAVFVIPKGYTNPVTTLEMNLITSINPEAKITFSGDGTMPVLSVKTMKLPSALSKIEFKNLTIIGASSDNTSNYIFNQPDNMNAVIDSVVFENCRISDFRSILRFQNNSSPNYVQKANTVIINNCIIKNSSTYGVLYNNKLYSWMGDIRVQRSTFYGFGECVFLLQKNISSIEISDCTFDNVVLSTSKKYVLDLSSQAIPVTIRNSIMGRSSNVAGILNTSGVITIINCYTTSDYTAIAPPLTTTIIGSLTHYTSPSSLVFKTPTITTDVVTGLQTTTEADYTIIDKDFPGKDNAGDPRWYYQEPNDINSVNRDRNIWVDGKNISLKLMSDIVVLDMTGRIVLSENNTNKLDCSKLEKGVYIVKARSNSIKISTLKILIE